MFYTCRHLYVQPPLRSWAVASSRLASKFQSKLNLAKKQHAISHLAALPKVAISRRTRDGVDDSSQFSFLFGRRADRRSALKWSPQNCGILIWENRAFSNWEKKLCSLHCCREEDAISSAGIHWFTEPWVRFYPGYMISETLLMGHHIWKHPKLSCRLPSSFSFLLRSVCPDSWHADNQFLFEWRSKAFCCEGGSYR